MRALVVVPTYNEAADVVQMIETLLDGETAVDVCIVDDSSPDGTSALVAVAIAERDGWSERVELITREGKGGRGGAVREGLRIGLQRGYDVLIEMDCDFSHDPRDLVVGIAMLSRGWNVVIGARYPNGKIIGWPLKRRVFSRFANTLARALIEWSVPDYTNGFRFYDRAAAEAIVAEPQRHTGYIYLSESMAACFVSDLSVGSFPIVFRNRERGESSTNFGEILAAAKGVIDIAIWYRRRSRRA